ncbi:MAG: hypothetical protein L0154_06360 [Chloroflexi bacterium]|nr:hypothetical protein [Chloroflexota bacterium]
MADLFVGKWQLREADYESGQPPREAAYIIEHDHNGYCVKMDWLTDDGEHIRAEYFAIPDGEQYPVDNPAAVDNTMSMVRIDEKTLDSTVKQNGDVVAHARRVLSKDGNIMTITQSTSTLDGNTFQNVSVYVRVPE